MATTVAWLPSFDGPTELPLPATVVIVYCPCSEDGKRQAIASAATTKQGVARACGFSNVLFMLPSISKLDAL
jgi:hypothetical protein